MCILRSCFFSELENTLENISVLKIYWLILVSPISQNELSLFSHLTLSQIKNSTHGHLVKMCVHVCFPETIAI